MSCLSDATSAISKLSALKGRASEISSKLSKQAGLIPMTGGGLDELGQNASAYISEISATLSNGVINPLSQTINSAPSIFQKAKEEDDAIERARLLAQQRWLARKQKELEEEESIGNILGGI